MAHEAQERANARGLFEQAGLVVTGGAVGLVGEQQAAKVALGTFLAAAYTAKAPVSTRCSVSAGWSADKKV
jgi:hypothetical protein